MFIGSNNSLTYLKPNNDWFENIFNLGKCQEVDYETQYLFYGVRLFDFKLFVDHNNHIIVKNGIYEYPMFSFYEILDFLNKKGDAIVLITLDTPYWHYSKHMVKLVEDRFKEICRIIESIYEYVWFCGGYGQYNGKKLYKFDWEEKNEMPTLVKPCDHSRLYRFVTKWCPMFIGKLNRKYIKRFEDKNVYLMLNYVNRR